MFRRRRGVEKRRLGLYYDREVAESLEAYCAREDRDMGEVVNEAVRGWLKRQK